MAAYLSTDEYRSAPTAVDSFNLVSGGSADAQDAELARRIRSACAFLDGVMDQPAKAASRIEVLRAFARIDGTVSLHPSSAPLNQITALSTGVRPTSFTAATITDAWIDHANFVVPVPLSLPTSSALAKVTYVSGWPDTTLTSAVAVNAVSLPLTSVVGFAPTLGSPVNVGTVWIIDGPNTEQVTLVSVGVSSITVSACVRAHPVGAVVSVMPDDIKQAAILATSAFIKTRGAEAVVMTSLTPSQITTDPSIATQLGRAAKMVENYRRQR